MRPVRKAHHERQSTLVVAHPGTSFPAEFALRCMMDLEGLTFPEGWLRLQQQVHPVFLHWRVRRRLAGYAPNPGKLTPQQCAKKIGREGGKLRKGREGQQQPRQHPSFGGTSVRGRRRQSKLLSIGATAVNDPNVRQPPSSRMTKVPLGRRFRRVQWGEGTMGVEPPREDSEWNRANIRAQGGDPQERRAQAIWDRKGASGGIQPTKLAFGRHLAATSSSQQASKGFVLD